MDEDDEFESTEVEIANQCQLDVLVQLYRGFLSLDRKKALTSYADIIDGAKYHVISPYHTAVMDERTQRQTDASVLETEIGLCVAASFEAADIHMNVKGKYVRGTNSGKDAFELDAVVVDGDTAYVIECAHFPQVGKVAQILKKIAQFEKSPEVTLPPFDRCRKFVPVLGGRKMSPKVLALCQSKQIKHVKPNGFGYIFNRSMSSYVCYALKVITK